jgi:hypothetical protein
VLLTCIRVVKDSETNVMHFLFSLLRIKCIYMFRGLLAHPQEVLHKLHLVYCVCVMSVGCTRIGVSDLANVPEKRWQPNRDTIATFSTGTGKRVTEVRRNFWLSSPEPNDQRNRLTVYMKLSSY